MKHVIVIGLGRIGLPMALILKRSGFQVTGIDIDADRLNVIKTKALPMDEPDMQSLFSSSEIFVSEQAIAADIFLICVPTPLTREKKPDLSHLKGAIAMIQPFLTKGKLVIIESTCPIGTTNEVASHYPGVHFAYCPERVMPGNLIEELIKCDRIIGGVDEESTEKAIELYSCFCKGFLHKTRAKMAEAVKLAENAYRNINIALANELSMLAERLGLSDQELIAFANCHPRVNILKPGVGVGGHCIPIDPNFLISAFAKETTLLQAACTINEQKQVWVEKKIEKTIKQHRCNIIAFLGLTYKANISDFRNSPALALYHNLKDKYQIIPIDPFYPKGIPMEKGIKQAEMVVGLVKHHAFHVLDRNSLNGKVVLDFAEVFS